MGPVASQEAIKMIGTNGGGFFNANSAHPYENPTPLTNFLQMLAYSSFPAGYVLHFGMMVGDRRQGWAVFSAMAIVFVVMAGVALWAEQAGNPVLTASGADQVVSAFQSVAIWRERNSLWYCFISIICNRYHGSVLRRCERHA